MTSLTQRCQNYKMNAINGIRFYSDALWNKDNGLGLWGSGRYISTFKSFNTNTHHDQAYYYVPSGYMLKFHEQAILRSTIECSSDSTKTYTVSYVIYLKNINCKRANLTCRNTCTEVDSTRKVYHQNNFVTGYLCETDYPIGFHQEFYEFLRDFIKHNIGFGLDRVQVYMCKQKGVWINNELLVRLYSIFNDGQIFEASD